MRLEKGKLISVYGSSGSGKTFISYLLAYYLTAGRKNVIALNTDPFAPALSVWVPMHNSYDEIGLGSLLVKDEFAESEVYEKIIMHPKSQYLGFMGHQKGVTPFTYTEFKADTIYSLFRLLVNKADYVIADCTRNPVSDPFSLTAMELADIKIRCITPNPKGILYDNIVSQMLKEERFDFDKHIVIMNEMRDYSPEKELRLTYGNWNFTLPTSHELDERVTSGQLPTRLKKKDALIAEAQLKECANLIRKW